MSKFRGFPEELRKRLEHQFEHSIDVMAINEAIADYYMEQFKKEYGDKNGIVLPLNEWTQGILLLGISQETKNALINTKSLYSLLWIVWLLAIINAIMLAVLIFLQFT